MNGRQTRARPDIKVAGYPGAVYPALSKPGYPTKPNIRPNIRLVLISYCIIIYDIKSSIRPPGIRPGRIELTTDRMSTI